MWRIFLRSRFRAALCHQTTGYTTENNRDRPFPFGGDIGLARISGFYHGRVDWNLSQEGSIEFLGHFPAAPLFKYVDRFATLRADEAAHVLDYAEYRQIELAAEYH